MKVAGTARTVDRSWPITVFVACAAISTGTYIGLVVTSDEAVLLGRLNAPTRAVFYGSVSATSGALLGLIIASISILLTLDETRERVREMQSIPAWRILHVTLLAAAGFLAITLALSTIALGVDAADGGATRLEIAVFASCIVAFGELIVGGVAFALVVWKLTKR